MFRLYVILGLILTVLGLGATLYWKGGQAAKQKALVESLRDDLADARESLTLYREAYQEDQERAAAAAAAKAALQAKITELNEYVDALEDRDFICLSEPDTNELRQLWLE